MTFDIHVTVELQPSPQLVQLLEAMRQPEHKQPTMPSMGETERLPHPGPEQPMSELDKFMKERKERKRQDLLKPQEAQEEPKDPEPKETPNEPEPVLECFKSFFLPKEHPEFISLSKYNKHLSYFRVGNKICIQYRAARIFTTIYLIKQLGDTVPEYIQIGDFRKRPISNQKTAINQFWFAVARGLDLDTLVDRLDPDAEFRPMLQQNTRADYDGGKIEGSLED